MENWKKNKNKIGHPILKRSKPKNNKLGLSNIHQPVTNPNKGNWAAYFGPVPQRIYLERKYIYWIGRVRV